MGLLFGGFFSGCARQADERNKKPGREVANLTSGFLNINLVVRFARLSAISKNLEDFDPVR
jgi:hypothetical protein